MNDFWTVFAALVAVLMAIGSAYAVGVGAGRRKATLELNDERERMRFSELYAPMVGMFTTCHITTVGGYGAPYFRQRLRKAWGHLRRWHLVKAFESLSDKEPTGAFGEVEFGAPFPLHHMTEHLVGKEKYADPRLLVLVAQANRARHEDPPVENELTEQDLALHDHVWDQHDLLAKRFSGSRASHRAAS